MKQILVIGRAFELTLGLYGPGMEITAQGPRPKWMPIIPPPKPKPKE